MDSKFLKNSRVIKALLLSAALLSASPGWSQVRPLDNEEADGYLQWLHSLEKTVAAREEAGLEEGNLLFPFDTPGWSGQEAPPYRHLAISKAIMELEHQWQLRGQDRESSALVALSHARNYTNLSEFDSAVVWYEAAARLDTLSLFSREIAHERMAVASVVGDSLSMIQLVTNTLGRADLTSRQQELILAYRWLLTSRDSYTLRLLLAKVEAQPELMTPKILFWHAFSESWLEMKAESLNHLRQLVRAGGLSEGLTESQRAWVLLAIPDQIFLLGDNQLAHSLYEPLTRSQLKTLKTWATYQLANLDFVESRFGKAANGFGLVCEAQRLGNWQDQACEMAQLAQELDRIRTEGDAYGTAQFYQP